MQMINNFKLLKYLIWADNILEDQIAGLTEEQYSKILLPNTGSIYLKLKHLVEEYMAWLYDIQNRSWKEEYYKIQDLRFQELIQRLKFLKSNWQDFLLKNEKTEFEIKENDFVVSLSLDEVIFNLVNHSSYHRGQIMMMLRMLGYTVSISDFYW